MRILDFLIIIAMAWFGLKGFRKGLIDEIFSIIEIIIGAWFCIPVSELLQKIIVPTSEIRYLITLAISFIICVLVIYLISKIIKVSTSFVIPEIFDKLLGAVFGAFKILFLAGIIFYGIASVDNKEKILTPEAKSESKLYGTAHKSAELLLPKIKNFSTVISENETFKKINSKNKKSLQKK